MGATNNTYYTSRGKKIADFFIGLALVLGGSYLINSFFVFLGGLYVSLAKTNASYSLLSSISSFGVPVSLIAAAIAFSYFKKQDRRFVSFGIVTAVILPFLFFGACMMMIVNNS